MALPADGTILLIEDNDGDALLVEEAVEDGGGGLRVLRAEDLAEGIALLAAEQVVCVLCDLGLPGVQGTEAVAALVQAHPDVPVVVLTGRDDGELAGLALEAGAQDYLVKSHTLDPDRLMRAVRYAVERQRILRDLREANSQLSQFAGLVAHDLKSPLAGLIGYLRLALTRADGEVGDMLGHAEGAAVRLGGIVDSLLEYARVSSGEGRPERVELAPMAADLATAFVPSLAEVGGAVAIAPRLPDVIADPAALRHALHNLLANAVKYAHPARPVRITVGASLEGGRCVLTVSDNGMGIPEDAREAVFEPGVQLDEGSPGIGLGLPSVRHVARAAGGDAWVTDGPDGIGTTVHLSLPPWTPAKVQNHH